MENKKKPSALKEQKGIPAPSITNTNAIATLRANRRQKIETKALIQKILEGNIVALSQAITLIESTNSAHHEQAKEIIEACLPYTNKSIRIGITGVPGVGKSTFIEAFGTLLTSLGHQVAVLAIDPSSSLTHGSILGDKTRMEELVKNKKAYIRPSASGDSLGGVARKTRESIMVCEACGYDIILVETVGVGQSETAVHSMVDFFLLLNLAGAGDELQGIKRGIMEMADAVVINKADGENLKKAQLARLEYLRALHLFPKKESEWAPEVRTCSALEQSGIEKIWEMINSYITLTQNNHYFETNRQNQNQYWMLETIQEEVLLKFYNSPTIAERIEHYKQAVKTNEISPFTAAQDILNQYFNHTLK